jgi:hypothetical protein
VNQVLNDIPVRFALSPEDEKLYQDYLSYFTILLDLKSQNLTIFDIKADQQNQLMQIAIHGADPVQSYARNVLLANSLIIYQEPLYLPDENKSLQAGRDPDPKKFNATGSLKLFPNPAQQYIILEYDISSEINGPGTLLLTIISGDGKVVNHQKITKLQDQLLIDCRHFSSGSYICKIAFGRKTLATGKFILAKQ